MRITQNGHFPLNYTIRFRRKKHNLPSTNDNSITGVHALQFRWTVALDGKNKTKTLKAKTSMHRAGSHPDFQAPPKQHIRSEAWLVPYLAWIWGEIVLMDQGPCLCFLFGEQFPSNQRRERTQGNIRWQNKNGHLILPCVRCLFWYTAFVFSTCVTVHYDQTSPQMTLFQMSCGLFTLQTQWISPVMNQIDSWDNLCLTQ